MNNKRIASAVLVGIALLTMASLCDGRMFDRDTSRGTRDEKIVQSNSERAEAERAGAARSADSLRVSEKITAGALKESEKVTADSLRVVQTATANSTRDIVKVTTNSLHENGDVTEESVPGGGKDAPTIKWVIKEDRTTPVIMAK